MCYVKFRLSAANKGYFVNRAIQFSLAFFLRLKICFARSRLLTPVSVFMWFSEVEASGSSCVFYTLMNLASCENNIICITRNTFGEQRPDGSLEQTKVFV